MDVRRLLTQNPVTELVDTLRTVQRLLGRLEGLVERLEQADLNAERIERLEEAVLNIERATLGVEAAMNSLPRVLQSRIARARKAD